MSLRPDLTVAAVVERNGEFLLVEERVGNRMVINQPAGHVERGEQLLDAIIRETLEETAWTFVPRACSCGFTHRVSGAVSGKPHSERL